MSEDGRKIAQGWHRFQNSSGSCVAACHAIVDARYGGEGAEQEAYATLDGEFLDTSRPENLDVLAARVRRHEVAIVTVTGANWMALARDRKLRSPYGDLSDSLHAVVIIAAKDNVFVVLDPYFPKKYQPVLVSRDDFATAWTGEVTFAGPDG